MLHRQADLQGPRRGRKGHGKRGATGAHKEIARYRKRLSELVEELATAEERERRRLASGLHDRVGQPLALAVLRLAKLESTVPQEAAVVVREVRASLKQVVRTTRELSFEVSNPLLHSAGLGPALEDLARRIEVEQDLGVDTRNIDVTAPVRSEAARIVGYQVVRELLLNAVKHGASRVELGLRSDGAECLLVVEDRGAGFDPGAVSTKSGGNGGFGLLKVRERVDRFGGHLEIDSVPGRGTRAEVRLPLVGDDDRRER